MNMGNLPAPQRTRRSKQVTKPPPSRMGRNRPIPVPADFVALAGSALALWGDPARSDAEILDAVAETVGVLSSECAVHSDGPFLAACRAAESYLLTWQDELPFGRPLAP